MSFDLVINEAYSCLKLINMPDYYLSNLRYYAWHWRIRYDSAWHCVTYDVHAS